MSMKLKLFLTSYLMPCIIIMIDCDLVVVKAEDQFLRQEKLNQWGMRFPLMRLYNITFLTDASVHNFPYSHVTNPRQ